MIENPYPGLRPFQREEAHLFFGRDGQVDAILSRLQAQRFVAVVGVSGCGKSSLLNAGVFPDLQGGLLAAEQREWRIARLQPRDRPLRSLARALVAAGGVVDQGAETVALAQRILQHSSGGLIDLVRGRLASEPAPMAGGHAFALLIVVDQFEEIFRFARTSSPEEAAHFVQLLIETVRAGREGLPVYVALAMRSDFQGECTIFPGLPELINQAQYLVPRMDLRQREAAIVRPAATEGRALARPLVDRLLDDMGENPDQLPVLQHALQRTWEAWRQRTGGEGELTLGDYQSDTVGGMAGAIEKHAEATYSLLDPSQQQLAPILFRCITEQTDGRSAIRRPLPLALIAKIARVPVEELVPLIDVFRTHQRTFLTPPEVERLDGDSLIDISHESLIRHWPRLKEWVANETAAAAELRRLRDSQAKFALGKQDSLDWIEMARVLRWHKGYATDDPKAVPQIVPSQEWASLYLGNASEEAAPDAAVQPVRSAEEQRRLRNEQAARTYLKILEYIAESARRLKRRRRTDIYAWLTIIMLGLAVVIGLVMYGLEIFKAQREQARLYHQAETESKRRLVALQSFAATTDMLMDPIVRNGKAAVAAAEQQAAKITAILQTADTGTPPDETSINELRRTLAAANQATDAIVKFAKSVEDAARATNDASLWPRAAELAVDVLEVRSQNEMREYRQKAQAASERALETRLAKGEQLLAGLSPKSDPDPATVKAQRDDLLAATANQDAILAIDQARSAFGFPDVSDATFRPRLASAALTLFARRKAIDEDEQKRRIRSLPVWNPEQAVGRFTQYGSINRLRFVPGLPEESPLVATVGEDRFIRVWKQYDVTVWAREMSSAANDIAFSPHDDAAAVASNGSTVRVFRWTPATDPTTIKFPTDKPQEFERHTDAITDVEYSHGGERIASASADRTVRVFDSQSFAQAYFTSPPLPGIITSVRFHPHDNLLVSGCDDGGVRLHTIGPPGIALLGKFDAPVRGAEFSASGSLVLAASSDQTARVWAVDPALEILKVAHPAPVTHATFRPVVDGTNYAFVTCATNGEVRFVRFSHAGTLTHLETDTVLEPTHPGAALSATWSADGKWLATAGGGEAILWRWTNDKPVAQLRIAGLHPQSSRTEFSPGGRFLATYGGGTKSYLWDLSELPDP